MKEIRPRSSINATVSIPGSKSLTHRALIAASLAEGRSQIENPLNCEDTFFTLRALRELGVQISRKGSEIIVLGTGGKFPTSPRMRTLFVGNSGTSYRLLLSTVSLAMGSFMLTGSSRMNERPIGDLIKALHRLGVEASFTGSEGFPPVIINARGIFGGKVVLSGKESSQYVSSLLLAAPYAKKGIEIEVKGDLVSTPYVDLTLDVMNRFGISPVRDGYRYFKVSAGPGYIPSRFAVEGDVSSASYYWAAAAVTGGTVTTENVYPYTTAQGDIGFLEILEKMGCIVERDNCLVTVHGNCLSAIEVDMRPMPDMVPTLAAIALFAKGKTVIQNVEHLRHKESDRLRAIAMEWERLGGRIDELQDGLIVHGMCPLQGGVVDPHNDHRLAMSLAVLGLRLPGTRIRNHNCINKSFPNFWEVWDMI